MENSKATVSTQSQRKYPETVAAIKESNGDLAPTEIGVGEARDKLGTSGIPQIHEVRRLWKRRAGCEWVERTK